MRHPQLLGGGFILVLLAVGVVLLVRSGGAPAIEALPHGTTTVFNEGGTHVWYEYENGQMSLRGPQEGVTPDTALQPDGAVLRMTDDGLYRTSALGAEKVLIARPQPVADSRALSLTGRTAALYNPMTNAFDLFTIEGEYASYAASVPFPEGMHLIAVAVTDAAFVMQAADPREFVIFSINDGSLLTRFSY